MDTSQFPITNISYWRILCRWRVILILLLIGLSAACTSRQAQVPQPESATAFPEVAHIAFTGNTHFSSGKLRKVMATKQRPLLPPWGHGEPYNPPTLEADLLRLKKFYFDQGFLEAKVRLEKVDDDPDRRKVRIVIALEEGEPT